MKVKNFIRILLSVTISSVLILYLIKDYTFHDFNKVINNINIKILIIGFISTLCAYLLSGLRWKYLFREYSYMHSFNGVIVALTANSIIPARGGEIIRSIYLKKTSKNTITQNIARIIVERIIDFTVVFTLLIITSITIGSMIVDEIKLLKYIGIFIIAFSLFLLFIFKRYDKAINKKISFIRTKNKLADKILFKLLELLNTIKILNVKELCLSILLTIIISLLTILGLFFYLKGSGIEISYFQTLIIYPLILFSISLPISVGYVGIYHSTMIYSLALFGYNDSQIVGKVILVHLLTVLIPVLYGSVIIAYTFFIQKMLKKDI